MGAVFEAGMTPEAALQRYPQCAPYASMMRGGPGMTVGQIPPQVMPGGSAYTPPYTPQFVPALPPAQTISYSQGALPAMAGLPALGGMAARALPMIGSAAGRVLPYASSSLAAIRRALPTLKREIAIASGLVLLNGIWWSGSTPVGKSRRRRRINPLNYRAALRAASRLCKVHDMTARIERSLPCAPGGTKRIRRRRKKSCR